MLVIRPDHNPPRLIRNRGGHCVTTLKVWTLIPISAGGGDTVVVGIGFCHAVDHGTEENLHKICICYLSSNTYLELTVEVVVAGYQVAQADSDERYSQSMNLKTGFWTGVVLPVFYWGFPQVCTLLQFRPLLLMRLVLLKGMNSKKAVGSIT